MFTQEILASLNDLELSIYNCVIQHQDQLPNMKIKDLADAAHVSTGTVLRFCKKLGCAGYSEFKLRYREYLERANEPLEEMEGEITFRNFISSINSEAFQKSIDHAFELLRDSKQIIFVGIGSSGILGKYGARFFSNVGRFSLYVEDPFLPILQELAAQTVTVALSESGNTRETLVLANQARERGSRLIVITNTPSSTLARIADCGIYYHVPKIMVGDTNITTQVPVIYILETLARKLYTLR